MTTEKRPELIADVQTEIAQLLCDSAPSVDQIAGRLNMSTRTLQRRLAMDCSNPQSILEADEKSTLLSDKLESTLPKLNARQQRSP